MMTHQLWVPDTEHRSAVIQVVGELMDQQGNRMLEDASILLKGSGTLARGYELKRRSPVSREWRLA